jgi:fluoride exporter
MTVWVLIAAIIAGALGAVLRYSVSRVVKAPRAVLVVNVAGSLIAGALLAVPGDLRYIVAAGFAGGLTTFSTWTVETVQLMLDGKSRAALGNVVVNVAAGLVAALLGFAITGAIVGAL